MKAASVSIEPAALHAQLSRNRTSSRVDGRIFATALLVSAGCFLGSELGTWLRFPGPGTAIIFPPYAVLTVALLISPARYWWVYLFASFVGHSFANFPHWPTGVVLVSEAANFTKALLAAIAIRHFNPGPRLNSFRRMATFLVFGVAVAPASAAFIGAAMATHYLSSSSYWLAWRAWFLSNALTGATLLPVLLISITDFPSWLRAVSLRRLTEIGLVAVSLLTTSYFVFVWPAHTFSTLPPRSYLLFPILLWAAVRLGPGGTSAAILAVSAMAIGGAMRADQSLASMEDLLALQLFVIIVSVPLLFLAALIDERDEVSETLHEREERIGLAAETANFALWTIDFLQRESWMSDAGRELFGLEQGAPLSREIFLERVHPEDRRAVDEAIERAKTGYPTFAIEHRLLLPDGDTRWLISRGRYVHNDRGELSELIGVALDVTEQVRANLELRRKQEEMNRLNRVAIMGELTASLAHELKQPLAAIVNYAAAGKRFLARGKTDPKIFEELLGDVSADARRASDVIQGIRQLVRKSAGTRRSVDLNELVREVLKLLHSDLIGHATTVDTNLTRNALFVKADPVQLQQVLLNLLMNAIEAMHDTPAENHHIEISTRSSSDAVRLSVRDYGPGLPQDDPQKVFAKFFSTKPNGMGMGLSIVHSIVQAHGGELVAENLGDGARFSFHLPAA